MNMKSKAIKESDRKDKVIRGLTIFAVILLGLVLHAHWLLATLPKEFECHFPPDLSRGGMVKVNEFQRHEVYAFAYNVYQQLNRCEQDCAVEFQDNIRKYGYFVTDSYRPQLMNLAKVKESDNRRKVRGISEYGAYSDSKVVPLGNNTWIVYLDVVERELIGGKVVRDAVMRYPLIVTKYNVNREKNPWRLAIDGMNGQPKRLN